MLLPRLWLAALLVLLSTVPVVAREVRQVHHPATGASFAATDEVVITWRDSADAAGRGRALGRENLQAGRQFARGRLQRARAARGQDIDRLLERLRRDPDILNAEPDYLARQALTFSDPLAARQWQFAGVHLPGAWNLTTGSPDVLIAIIDSGLDPTHPDLAGQFIAGFDYVNNDVDPADDNGHGTLVAGLAAAGVNGTGITGAAPQCRLLIHKVIAADGSASYADVAEAIIAAADAGVRVINLSICGYAAADYLQAAVDYAIARGCVLVAAAGNDHRSDPVYPAACAGVIGVAALEVDDLIASFSNFGGAIDIAAPGVNLLTTRRGGDWGVASGTSLAAPVVSGIAALCAARYPGENSAALCARLLTSARDAGLPGRDDIFGHGVVDAHAALLIPAAAPVPETVIAGTARLDVRPLTDTEFAALRAQVGTAEAGRSYNRLVSGFGTGMKPPTEEEWAAQRATLRLATAVLPDGVHVASVPDSHDNSATKWFPPVGNQSTEGTCVTWTIGYYIKSFQEAKEHDWDLSALTFTSVPLQPSGSHDRIMSPDFLYHLINDGVDNGSWYGDAVAVIRDFGCATWQSMPYDVNTSDAWPGQAAWREAPLYRGSSSMITLNVTTDSGLTDLKTLLAGGNLAAIRVNADYYDTMTAQDFWTVDNYDTPATPNHGNTVVGYSDTWGPYNEEGDTRYGAFKVANQWGKTSNWENVHDGFVYVSYAAMRRCFGQVFYFTDSPAYNPQLLATCQLTHTAREQVKMTAVSDDTGAPTARAPVTLAWSGAVALSDTFFAFDATALLPQLAAQDTAYLQVFDVATLGIGAVRNVTLERYGTYDKGGVADTVYYATDTGTVNMVNGCTVDVAIPLRGGVATDTAGPNHWYVATTGDTSNSGLTAGAPKRYLGNLLRGSANTLGYAMVSAGDTVHVAAGTYSETVSIDTDGVCLAGAGNATVIDAGGGSRAIDMTGQRPRLENLQVRNVTAAGVRLTGDSAYVAGLYVQDGGGRGLWLAGSSGGFLENLTMVRCDTGLAFTAGADRNLVRLAHVLACTAAAVEFTSASHNVLYNCTLDSTAGYDVVFAGTADGDSVIHSIFRRPVESDSRVLNHTLNRHDCRRNTWYYTDVNIRTARSYFDSYTHGAGGDSVLAVPYRYMRVDTTAGEDTLAPAPPDSFTVQVTTTGCTVWWSVPTLDEDGRPRQGSFVRYIRYRYTGAEPDDLYQGAGFTRTSVTPAYKNDESLTPGTTYYYRFASWDLHSSADGSFTNYSWFSDTLAVYIPRAATLNVVAVTRSAADSVVLAGQADSVQVRVCLSNAGDSPVILTGDTLVFTKLGAVVTDSFPAVRAAGNPQVIPALGSDTLLYYVTIPARTRAETIVVSAYATGYDSRTQAALADGSDSDGATGDTAYLVVADTQPPAAVPGVGVRALGCGARFTWARPADSDWFGMRLVRRADTYPGTCTDAAAAWSEVRVTDAACTAVADSGASDGTRYYYAVYAFDDAGHFTFCDTFTVLTDDITGDGRIDLDDVGALGAAYGGSTGACDLDMGGASAGVVDGADLNALTRGWRTWHGQ